MKPRLDALLLDLDGTLIDSHPVLRAAYERFLAEHGLRGSDEEYQRWNGPPLAEIVAGLRADHGLDEPAEVLYARYLALVERSYLDGAALMPGAEELLAWIAAEGIATAVVTSAPRRLAVPLLEARGVLDGAVVVCGDEVTRGKPDAEPYRTALLRLGVAPERAMAVEDTVAGVRAATGAGLRCLGVGPHEAQLSRAGALAWCPHLANGIDGVRELLDGWRRGPGRVLAARSLRAVLASGSPASFDEESEHEVDTAWRRALARKPQLRDGEVLSVRRVAREPGEVLHIEVEAMRYRQFIAQRDGVPLGLRPLGVNGVTRVVPDRGEPLLVLGRRTSRVTQYAGAWELCPAGGVERSRVRGDGVVDCAGQLLDELHEELGLGREAVRALVPLGLIEDLDEHVLDACFRIDVAPVTEDALAAWVRRHDEYDAVRLVTEPELRALLTRSPEERPHFPLAPTVEPLLRLLRQ